MSASASLTLSKARVSRTARGFDEDTSVNGEADRSVSNRLGVVSVVVESPSAVDEINDTLHDNAGLIIGRMGVPYREREVSIISLIVDGTNDEISAMTGRLGRIPGVSVKTALAKQGRSGDADEGRQEG